jgi:phosphoribosylamine--glycine ligase
LGDPETQVLLPALKDDLLDLMQKTVQGILPQNEMIGESSATIGVVLASGGYPGEVQTGFPIGGLESLNRETLLFHAGTTSQENHLITKAGRVLTVVAQGNSLAEAYRQVYAECAKISFSGKTYRKDIGQRKRVA